MKLSSAARRSSVSFLISSSLAPRSSACFSASCAARNALSTSVMSPSSMVTASAHRLATTSRSASSVWAASSCAGDAVEAEILAGLLRHEQFRRDHQRVERIIDLGVLVGVERQDAALLDQRPRQGLCEQPLRQPHVEGLAAALIAGLVLRRQRQRDVGAGVRVLAQDPSRSGRRHCGSAHSAAPAETAAGRTAAARPARWSARPSAPRRGGRQNAPALR